MVVRICLMGRVEEIEMKFFDQAKFNNFIIEHNVIGFFEEPVTLKSGRISNWYVNWRRISNDVLLLDMLSDFVHGFVCEYDSCKLDPDCYYGVPEGATKLAIITQYKHVVRKRPVGYSGRYTLPMGRGKPKEHGKPEDRFFLGTPAGDTVVLEDVTTTGGSLLQTLAILGGMYETVNVIMAVGLTNRMELRDDGKSVHQAVNLLGKPYFAMSDALDLLPLAVEKMKPGTKIIKAIEAEFEEFGVEKLKLR